MQGNTYPHNHNYLEDFDFTDPITPMEQTAEEAVFTPFKP
jgi:hypothetical protein